MRYAALLQMRTKTHAISAILYAQQHPDSGRPDGGYVAVGGHTDLRVLHCTGRRRHDLPCQLVSPNEIRPLSTHRLIYETFREFSLSSA